MQSRLFGGQSRRCLEFSQGRFKLVCLLITLAQTLVSFKVLLIQAQRLLVSRDSRQRLVAQDMPYIADQLMGFRVIGIKLQSAVIGCERDVGLGRRFASIILTE